MPDTSIHHTLHYGVNLKKDIHDDLGLRRVINARGSYTPFGVSRSHDDVADAVAESLKHYFVMSELAEAAGDRIAKIHDVESVGFSHCAAGSITIAIAALIVGKDMDLLYRLPDTTNLANRVVIQAGHLVDYGQPTEQAIRLAGAEVVVAGNEQGCSVDELKAALAGEGICALMCVESRLCKPGTVASSLAVELAHEKAIPVIIDGAAQDLRLSDVLSFGADITLTSGQKYYSGPTCGLALGSKSIVQAMALQEKGIGRAMKPTKEGIIGALAAVELRDRTDMDAWTASQKIKSEDFAAQLNKVQHLNVACEADQTGLPFQRVRAVLDEVKAGYSAHQVAEVLAAHDPMISVQEHEFDLGVLNFEIIGLAKPELEIIYERLSDLLD